MSAPAVGVTPPDDSASLYEDAEPSYEYQESALGGPLGPRGPAAGGMLSLPHAVEVVAQMRAEHAARQRREREERRAEADAQRAQLRDLRRR